MDTLMKADIFFFITAIAVVLGGLLFTVILIYGIMIAKNLLAVSKEVKRETELIAGDLDQAREHIKQKASDFGSIFSFLKGIFGSGKKTKK